MHMLEGIAVSPGVAIGEALVIDNEGIRIPRRFTSRDAVEGELDRLARAIDQVSAEIASSRDQVTAELGEKYGGIFSAHLQMISDESLRRELDEQIRQQQYSAEYAVSDTLRRYAKVFETLESSYLAERSHDVLDIQKRLLHSLLGRRREELAKITAPIVVLAHNLTPSETAGLNREFVLGFATEIGGVGGHTSIVAEAMGIPAVVGSGRFVSDVSAGDLVIVDGDQGCVILQPDEETLAHYRREAEQHISHERQLESLRELPAETADGTRIEVLANIEFPEEVQASLERGADGIGLYRTEFLYLGAVKEPTEEIHFEAYSKVVKALDRQPVIVRTLDLGADKMGHLPHSDDEINPFLGLRSIRLSLRHRPLFRTQLRAVLRASALGDVRIMFPLISTMKELRQAKSVLADVMEDLDEEGIAYNRNIPIGIMVEVPSAVMMLDRLAPEVSFVSIGTNDLVQYTLAVDRSNREVAGLYNSSDPAVLRLIKMIIGVGSSENLEVEMCGRMCGSPVYTMLLLGLGLRVLSMSPHSVPEIKRVCRLVTIEQCQRVAERALTMDDAAEIKMFLKEELKKAAPELTAA